MSETHGMMRFWGTLSIVERATIIGLSVIAVELLILTCYLGYLALSRT